MPSLAPIAGGPVEAGGSDADRVIFGGASAAGAGICLAAGSAFGASGDIFGGPSGLISILACCAKVSEVSGAISGDGCDGTGSWAGVSEIAGGFAEAAAEAGAAGI